ncbi:intradiol ring-cleavage dioxygenase [Sphingomonas sp. CL5.1]|uniref:dioxygenase family protein n=1 Tax=Sphingomonas sp. CL5.1 TaxID=2653203 RepID=UPI001582931C|nr:intradiol ring-cleavage dioxygenase [Sphingomonas sp. CL5.1]QKS01487.1 intradiol ring-cleavage dioxygenase [Sphingomonas sp. CL5.1]
MNHHHGLDDHDRGLSHDLAVMERLVRRRQMLRWAAGAGAMALLAGCGDDGTSGGSDTTTSSSTATPTPTPTPTATSTASPSACIADPTETNGPYPADGTNASSGSTSNVLTASGVVRGDIRASFIGSTSSAPGVTLTLTLTLVNANASCAPLSGYAIYIWCCDANGQYSLYSAPAESWLRGVQVTDGNGQVTFTMVFPGCYSGRWPHIHFEVYSSISAATSGRNAALISQIAMPQAVCDTVYADTATYPASATNLARITIASDNVFGDNTSAQIARMTASVTGSNAAGYVATNTIGIAV